MKLHWVRPNDVDITACGKDSQASVRPLTYLHAEAADFYAVGSAISSRSVSRCRRRNRLATALSLRARGLFRVVFIGSAPSRSWGRLLSLGTPSRKTNPASAHRERSHGNGVFCGLVRNGGQHILSEVAF